MKVLLNLLYSSSVYNVYVFSGGDADPSTRVYYAASPRNYAILNLNI